MEERKRLDEKAIVLYKLEDRPPLMETILLGLQHMLAMFVGIITPPLIVAGAIGLDTETTAFIVSMALIASGIATWLQIKTLGPIGSGLLGVHGTSFTFLPPAISAGLAGGLPLIFGMALITSPVEMVLSKFVEQARRIFPPVVTGSVVMMIGLSLIGSGMNDFLGGVGAEDFASPRNIILALFVLSIIIYFNRFGRGLARIGAVAVGIIVGYLVSLPLGLVDFGPVADAGWLTLPRPVAYGLSFSWAAVIPWVVAYFITSIETIGDLTATAEASGEPVTGKLHSKRLRGGVLADGIGSAIAAVFNSMPNTTFSQNIGVIHLTRIGSRVVGLACGTILLVLGFLPKIGALVSVMPRPVLGGATVAMFGLVATSGIRIVSRGGLTERNMFILAIGLALGMGVQYVPEATEQLPGVIASIFEQPIATTAIVTCLLNLIIPREEKEDDADDN